MSDCQHFGEPLPVATDPLNVYYLLGKAYSFLPYLSHSLRT